MSVLRDRPRFTAALFVALVVLVVLAMLAGGALAGGGNCTTSTAGGGDLHPQTQPITNATLGGKA